MATTIRTISGRNINLEQPSPESIDLWDIAHALGHTNRFNGHTRRPYSVARHCFIGSKCVTHGLGLEFLLHDAAEAYLGDVTGPLKALLGDSYKRLEREFERVIAQRFGIAPDFCDLPEIKHVDRAMLTVEMAVMHRDDRFAGNQFEGDTERRIAMELSRNDPPDPALSFLNRANYLMAERYLAEAYQCAK